MLLKTRKESEFAFGADLNKYGKILYSFNGTQHRYFPDCYDIVNNTMIEVKSTYTLTAEMDKLLAKKNTTLASTFNFRLVVLQDKIRF